MKLIDVYGVSHNNGPGRHGVYALQVPHGLIVSPGVKEWWVEYGIFLVFSFKVLYLIFVYMLSCASKHILWVLYNAACRSTPSLCLNKVKRLNYLKRIILRIVKISVKRIP